VFVNVAGHIMASELIIFGVHYKGSLNREDRCAYVGGFVDNH
jgi:hypothetical protein